MIISAFSKKLLNKIKKISKNKFLVYSGPYASFKELKETYFSLNKLGFENLNIINVIFWIIFNYIVRHF